MSEQATIERDTPSALKPKALLADFAKFLTSTNPGKFSPEGTQPLWRTESPGNIVLDERKLATWYFASKFSERKPIGLVNKILGFGGRKSQPPERDNHQAEIDRYVASKSGHERRVGR